MMNEVIILGRINLGRPPIGGETAKNQYLMEELGKYCKVIPLDFYRNKQRPWIFPLALFTLLLHPSATLILSTTASNIYVLMKILLLFNPNRRIIHWIIGGEFDQFVEKGMFDVAILNKLSWNLAQSERMVENLRNCGLNNVMYVRNFKNISYFPKPMDVKERCSPKKVKFVYLSRIMKSKGVDFLLDVVGKLNESGFVEKYSLDLYGKMDPSYESEFLETICKLSNVKYYGLLDLRSKTGYDKLANYHMMIFPTHHPSEGISGVFIDSFIASVPILASDWNHNKEVVKDGVNGLLFSTLDKDSLYHRMVDVIEGRIDLLSLSLAARKEADCYMGENVITPEYLKRLGII